MRAINLTVLLITAFVAVKSQNQLSNNFRHILNGSVPLTQESLSTMFEQFLSVYRAPITDLTSIEDYDVRTRKAIFEQKIRSMIAHNTDLSKSWKKGINAYSDMTHEEFIKYYHLVGENQECSATQRNSTSLSKDSLRDMPSHWDWRQFGVVTPVKDQGECGSCWTFSTVGTIEAHYTMKYHQYRNLSEQQLVDCAGAFDNNGCDGGLPSHAFEYIKYAGGLTTEAQYPYMGVDQTCKYTNGMKSVGVVGGSVNISLSEVDLQIALFSHGPISVAFNVMDDFEEYESGIYANSTCPNGPMDVNHAVVAVGYGTENGIDYWIIKNSWSTKWGEQGFFRMQRGVNMCGIVNCNSYPFDVIDLTSSESDIKEEITE